MYYLSMCVTPHWGNPDCHTVKKALAHFWVEAKDCIKAVRKAINYSEKHQWEVHSLKHNPTMVNCEYQACDPAGSTYFYSVLDQDISMCLTDLDTGNYQPVPPSFSLP